MKHSRDVRGWLMYDWANSAYVLTVATAVLPAYFASAVAPDGAMVLGGRLAASSLWGYAVSLASLVVFLTAPFLGALADASGRKKFFLGLTMGCGALATMALYHVGPGKVWFTLAAFMAAHAAFASANVFYDSLLPGLAPPRDLDRISARGFAYGYAGGGLHFLACLLLVAFHHQLGLSKDMAARVSMASAGAWWLFFSIPVMRRTAEWGPFSTRRAAPGETPGVRAMMARSLRATLATGRELARSRKVLLFLLAYLCYNDGVQSVIVLAAIYGKEALALDQTVLMSTLLAVQIVALGGALAFSRMAGKVGTVRALMLSLVLWTAVATYAVFITSQAQYVALGLAVGVVLGGTQSLSRSLYARMIPPDAPARYFGFFSVVTKLSAVGGPFLFALARQITGDVRPAVGVIALFFVAGLALLWPVSRTSSH